VANLSKFLIDLLLIFNKLNRLNNVYQCVGLLVLQYSFKRTRTTAVYQNERLKSVVFVVEKLKNESLKVTISISLTLTYKINCLVMAPRRPMCVCVGLYRLRNRVNSKIYLLFHRPTSDSRYWTVCIRNWRVFLNWLNKVSSHSWNRPKYRPT
jgi:hypothetical protein